MTGVAGTLTDTQWEVEDAEANVQPEEEDGVGHFTEEEQVAYVLLQCDWQREREPMNAAEEKQPSLLVQGQGKAVYTVMFTQQSQVLIKHFLGVVWSRDLSVMWISYSLGHKYLFGWSLTVTYIEQTLSVLVRYDVKPTHITVYNLG